MVYHDFSGHGSMKETLKYAKAIDNSIEVSDVQEWFTTYVSKKKKQTLKDNVIVFV